MIVRKAEFRPAFGYKTWWLAVRSTDAAAVASESGLGNVEVVAAAPEAFKRCRQEWRTKSLVVPTRFGWSFVLNSGGGVRNERQLRQLLEPLSLAFGEAHWYVNVRTSSCYGWGRAQRGEAQRAFFLEDGRLAFDVGERTKVEVEHGAGDFAADPRGDERTVIALAAEWSANPLDLTNDDLLQPLLLGERSNQL